MSNYNINKIEDLFSLSLSLRNFNPEFYLFEKCKLINDFFTKKSLDSVVVGLSGGIDSTLVLYLLNEASKKENSPIKKIIGLSLPINNSRGSSNQTKLVDNIILIKNDLSSSKNLDVHYIDFLGEISNKYVRNFIDELKEYDYKFNDWSQGQLDCILRTPAFYYMCSLLQTKGYKSIICGTTNRDEGEYIGFYGKASDGMNDLQIISDLHKSEVNLLSRYLNIPEKIINQDPRGDIYNNLSSEELMGFPYWFLQSYINLKYDYKLWNYLIFNLNEEESNLLNDWINKIENWNSINYHKYEVGRPSHFLDSLQRKIIK